MPDFIDYGTHGISLDVRKLERWALEREQHDENYDNFVQRLSDRIITIENKLDNGCGATVKRGHWEEIEDYDGDVHYRCTNCKTEFYLEAGSPEDNEYFFCPHCGADMRGDT